MIISKLRQIRIVDGSLRNKLGLIEEPLSIPNNDSLNRLHQLFILIFGFVALIMSKNNSFLLKAFACYFLANCIFHQMTAIQKL